ncbi:hypothetical protein GcM3_054021 [Golovinomyces cichoracearum]|uniref:Uncharacterized protein n=1 Tax=Golovinomyces cichoracearum TaxID=62708 RepID=A0A420IYI8_9PEZI|nr:hypothetical protein GcM3_054021 [Golovinomyces cichoracearum]
MLVSRSTNVAAFRKTCTVISQRIRSNSSRAVPSSRVSSGLIGGLAGGGLVVLAGYGFYHFSGMKQVVASASGTHKKIISITESIKSKAPPPNEALEWLRNNAYFYAYFIPGGRDYVDSIFQSIESIQQKHSKEFNDIINQTYVELKEVSKDGPSIDAATKGWLVLQKSLKRTTNLIGVSITESLDNHPQAKEKLSEKLSQLKSLAESHGPQAKRELVKVYQEAISAVREGLSSDSIGRVGKAIDGAIERIKKLTK